MFEEAGMIIDRHTAIEVLAIGVTVRHVERPRRAHVLVDGCEKSSEQRKRAPCLRAKRGRHFAVYLFVHTKHSQKAGPFSVARLKIDLPFHDRLAYNRVH